MLRATASTPENRERIARLLTLIAGIMQASIVFVVLFLPVFGRNCKIVATMTLGSDVAQTIETSCREYVSYLQPGGDWWRVGLLLLMFAIGIGAIITSRMETLPRVVQFCRQAIFVTVICVLVALWNFGLYLVPGIVLMVFAGYLGREGYGSPSAVPTLNKRERIARLFTLAGGVMQGGVALVVLFLPVISGQSYLSYSGSLFGYTFLFLMVIIGIGAVIVSTRPERMSDVCRFRWLAVSLSLIFAFLGAWSIDLLFAPGALLFLLAAVSGSNGHDPTTAGRPPARVRAG